MRNLADYNETACVFKVKHVLRCFTVLGPQILLSLIYWGMCKWDRKRQNAQFAYFELQYVALYILILPEIKYILETQGKGENIFVLHLRNPNKCAVGKIDFTYTIFLFHYKTTETSFLKKNYYFCLIYQ